MVFWDESNYFQSIILNIFPFIKFLFIKILKVSAVVKRFRHFACDKITSTCEAMMKKWRWINFENDFFSVDAVVCFSKTFLKADVFAFSVATRKKPQKTISWDHFLVSRTLGQLILNSKYWISLSYERESVCSRCMLSKMTGTCKKVSES